MSARAGRSSGALALARMKPSVLPLAALVVASAALLVALFAAFAPERTPVPAPQEEASEPESEGALLDLMARFQRFAEKLHASAEARNWPLATFYVEEIPENSGALAVGGFEDEGINISALGADWLPPVAEQLEAAVAAEDPEAFGQVYGALVATCNRCHQATGHPYVRIVIPTATPYPSQDFAPLPVAGTPAP